MTKTQTKSEREKKPNNFLPWIKIKTQKLGTFISGMIMPIIGIIIAWGLLTAFFIPTGWTPVAVINKYVVGNVLTWLIPILIGFLGGKQVYGLRGGWIGAAAVAGVVAGAQMFAGWTDYVENAGNSGNFHAVHSSFFGTKADLGPQFLGAMIFGPLAGFVLKKVEGLWAGKIKPGFEMLVDNFTLGILGMGMILLGFFVMPWIVYGVQWILMSIVDPLTKYKALPVTSLFVEPAKPLFLNNAIGNGIFVPLGNLQVKEAGKTILFWIESNPGPGMGMLLAYMAFDKSQRGAASSASLIHFFGGIHEVYFPFILMRPVLILATIAGGAVGVGMLQVFNAGAIAPASPGSIIALYVSSSHSAMDYAGLSVSIFASMGTSFIVAALLMKFTKNKGISKNEAIAKMNANKGKESKYVKAEGVKSTIAKEVNSIIFACDAGMGSSAMGAGLLRGMIKKEGLNIKVTNAPIRELGNLSTDLIVVQSMLAPRAASENPTQQFVVENFLDKPQYNALIAQLVSGTNKVEEAKETFKEEANNALVEMTTEKTVVINGKPKNVEEAIDLAGQILFENKLVKKAYIKSMHKRNADVSVYIGNGVAIPHGQDGSAPLIIKSGISITTYPKGIDWGGETVYLVVGIAGKGDKHMEILGTLATKLGDEKDVQKLVKSKTIKQIKEIFSD